MRRIAVLTALILLACGFACLADAAGNLPLTPAETLSGQKLEFPTAALGKPAIYVFGFSKAAGDKVKPWMTRLSQDGIDCWSIANLEGAPSLVRGMIRSSMRKGTPESLLARSLVMTKDAKAWKQALGVKQDNAPVAVLVDALGQVLWTYEGPFGEEPYHELKTRFEDAANPGR
jgi:hypothetical protein